MTDADAVTDSTDWLTTPLAVLAPLESSLRCQVCKEVFTTPMITSCSHTFCSLCIRRYLSQEGKCPSCRAQDQEMKLRHNWAVQELVEIWSENRQKIFDFAASAGSRGANEEGLDERPKKRRKVDAGVGAVVVQKSGLEERRSTRSQSRRVASQASQDVQALPSTQEEVPDSDAGSAYTESPDVSRHFQAPEPNDGLVGCPNCNRRMKETLINTHLDKCLNGLIGSPTPPPPPRTNHVSTATSPTRGRQAGTIAYTTSKPSNSATVQRLPSINYSLLNEANMRRKLKELGIPNTGSKDVMRRRHTEWMNLWNANCDSLQPVSKRKLLDELDRWERNLGRDERQRLQQQQNGGGDGASAMMMMDKEFDREGYMKRERSEFEDLIRKARESRKERTKLATATTTTTTTTGGEVEDESVAAVGDPGGAQEGIAAPTEAHDQKLGRPVADQRVREHVVTNGVHDKDEKMADSQVAHALVPNTPPRQPGATSQSIDLITPEKPEEQHLTHGQGPNGQEMLY